MHISIDFNEFEIFPELLATVYWVVSAPICSKTAHIEGQECLLIEANPSNFFSINYAERGHRHPNLTLNMEAVSKVLITIRFQEIYFNQAGASRNHFPSSSLMR